MKTLNQAKIAASENVPKNHTAHCFSIELNHSPNDLISIDCRALTTQQASDLANCLPFLACGEESAVHAFSRSLMKHVTPEEQFEMNAIAEDEMRHALWLASLRTALPEPTLILPQDMMTRFFKRLLTKQPALHFARVAALDQSVCKILAPLVRENAGLQLAPQIKGGLISIMRDEARHVKIAKTMAIKLGFSDFEFEQVNEQIHQELVQLLAPIASCLKNLATTSTKLESFND